MLTDGWAMKDDETQAFVSGMDRASALWQGLISAVAQK